MTRASLMLQTGPSPTFMRRLRVVLTCFSIAVNGLSAGGIFTFPLLSPSLASHLKLTQPQLTSIVLAGMLGQYLFSPLVGKIYDCYGPRTCSFIASILFTLGFGLFSREIARTPDDISLPSASSFHLLVLLFFMCGLGAVFSLISSMLTATKSFPQYPAMASGASLAAFGLSPLCLSFIASRYFTSIENGLDITHFLALVAVVAGSTHLLGALIMTISSPPSDIAGTFSSDVEPHISEHSPLLQTEPVESKFGSPEQKTVFELLSDPCFWLILPILGITLGLCEMVISNMGSIIVSLPSSSPSLPGIPSVDIATSVQVRLFATANTVSRLAIGPIADFLSPINSRSHESRRSHISRMSLISAIAFLLCLSCIWMDVGVRSQEALWPLSIGAGIVYGSTWTILPGVLSAIWGSPDLGRNFGIVAYAPVVGTPVFSYIYAFVSDHYAQDGGICRGVKCWHMTFFLASIAALLAFCGTLILGHRWRGRI